MEKDWTLSVSQLNEYVRVQLTADPILRHLRVTGEITGLKTAMTGHIYFSLKDDKAKVSCVMFRSSASGLTFRPVDGMRVVINGSASIYTQAGTFQVYVDSMQKEGLGDLYREFLILKERLEREGLFDPAIKRELPLVPRCVGIVTSESGAVLHDILRVGWARCPDMQFVLSPCSVQGTTAPQETVNAIKRLNEQNKCDVILCGRGGGSLEDLWAFNDEKVARAIRESRIPVVSCVGHETDFTIADFVADARAATPSNAAEIAIPDKAAQKAALSVVGEKIKRYTLSKIAEEKAKLDRIAASYVFRKPGEAWLLPKRKQIQDLSLRMDNAYRHQMRESEHKLRILQARLESLRPGAPLERGYALLQKDNQVISSIDSVALGDEVTVVVKDGKLGASVLSKTKGDINA